MKTTRLLALFLFLALSSQFVFLNGCRNKNNEPVPTPVKMKYAWVVGDEDSTHYGMILFTQDGCVTWHRQGEGSPALLGVNIMDVWAIDTNNVWAVGTGNRILKTIDRGKTWARITGPNTGSIADLSSISMVGSSDIWISGDKGIVYHSKDGGNSWIMFDTAFFHNGLMQGVYAINSQIAYVAGGIGARGFIARTSDGGLTWDSVVPENNYNRNEWIGVKATDPNHIIVYGVKAHYLFSADAGQSWKNDSVPGTGGTEGADINCLTMLTAQTCWGAFDYDGIYITTDNGTSWTTQSSAGPGAMYLFGIDYYDRNQAIIVAKSSLSLTGKIMITSNGGNTWEFKYQSRSRLCKVSFIKN